MEDNGGVWIFMGSGASQPAAVFTTLEAGEAWVRQHQVEGMLTWYPLGLSAYDWAVKRGTFKPSKPYQKTGSFQAAFSSAYQPHYHYQLDENIELLQPEN